MEIKIIKENKSIKPSDELLTLPKFCVLTGKNGSGKSHFLECLSKSEMAQILEEGKLFTEVKYIPFGGLNPQINADSNYQDIINRAKNVWAIINRSLSDYMNNKKNNPNLMISNYFGDINVKKIVRSFEKQFPNVQEWDEDYFLTHFDFNSLTQEQFFSSQFASVFKVYYNRLLQNFTMKALNEEYNQNNKFLSAEEFERLYGPRPWNLINEMMERAHLPYIVNNPEGETQESIFHINLKDTKRKIKVEVNDLSTGEKVLMSLAIAIYNTTEQGIKPDLLLIDEPDAPLHPEFSKFLIETVKYSIVEKAHVNVIITTHSPTTVAMADEDSLYRMNKNIGRPEKVTKSEALSILTSGLDNIRVSIENRRQVLVESKYDVEYYTKLYNIIPDYKKKYELHFIEATNREGSNCDDVKTLVKTFRDAGNESIYGIIDFDNKNINLNEVFVNGQRYSIENYIFDPIFIGFLLIREQICLSTEMQIADYTYVNLQSITSEDLQKIIYFVEQKLDFEITNDQSVLYELINGQQYSVNKGFFVMQGHDLESRIISKWPELQKITKGHNGDNLLKNHIIDTVINDYPHYISKDIKILFDAINNA